MKLPRITLFLLTFVVFSACSRYQVPVELTDEQLTAINEQMAASQKAIDEFTGEGYPYLDVVDLAYGHEQKGELGKAIKLYENLIDDGAKYSVVYNNLGRLYEKVERYDDAVAMYQRIIDEYGYNRYLYDITWVHIRAGDRVNAEKYFNAWQLEYNKTDEQTQDAIKKLREAETQ